MAVIYDMGSIMPAGHGDGPRICTMEMKAAGDPPADNVNLWCGFVWDPKDLQWRLFKGECPRCRAPWWMWFRCPPEAEAAFALGGFWAVQPFMPAIIAKGYLG